MDFAGLPPAGWPHPLGAEHIAPRPLASLETRTETPIPPKPRFLNVDYRCNSWLLKRIAYTTMPYKTGLRLLGVARKPANGFPARLPGPLRRPETTPGVRAQHERRASLAADGVQGPGPGATTSPADLRPAPAPPGPQAQNRMAQNRMALGVKGGGMLGQWYTLSPSPPVGAMPKTGLTRSEAPPTPSRG